MDTLTQSQIHNANDHSHILSEIKELRIDLKDAISVFRRESADRDEVLRVENQSLKNDLHEERRRIDEALRISRDTKSWMWKIASVVIMISGTAIAKALGFL